MLTMRSEGQGRINVDQIVPNVAEVIQRDDTGYIQVVATVMGTHPITINFVEGEYLDINGASFDVTDREQADQIIEEVGRIVKGRQPNKS